MQLSHIILNININSIKSWPKSPNYLSRRLNEIKTNLREKGIEIETGSKDEKNNRQIIIRKVLSILSYRLEAENHAQNEDKNVDNTSDDTKENKGSTVYTAENQNQNHAQKQDNRQQDSMDDTIHTKGKEENEGEEENQELSISCHYCNYKGSSENEVERHSFISHPGKPARPDPSLLKLIKGYEKEEQNVS